MKLIALITLIFVCVYLKTETMFNTLWLFPARSFAGNQFSDV